MGLFSGLGGACWRLCGDNLCVLGRLLLHHADGGPRVDAISVFSWRLQIQFSVDDSSILQAETVSKSNGQCFVSTNHLGRRFGLLSGGRRRSGRSGGALTGRLFLAGRRLFRRRFAHQRLVEGRESVREALALIRLDFHLAVGFVLVVVVLHSGLTSFFITAATKHLYNLEVSLKTRNLRLFRAHADRLVLS